MPVIEVVVLKLNKALAPKLEEKVTPALMTNLEKAGVQNKLRGVVVAENGRELKDEEFTANLFFQWPAIQNFKDFIASPYFHEFQAQVREGGYARGPSELKLIDTVDDLASLFGSNRVAEYLVVKPKDTSEVGVQNVLKKLQSGLPQFGASKVVAQSTLNLEPQEIVVLSSYTSDTELETAKASTARQQLLAGISSTADVTSLSLHLN